jgi:hypothetical protein
VSTLTIAIGNSDDGLSQKEWAAFWRATHDTVLAHAARVYGTFLSACAVAVIRFLTDRLSRPRSSPSPRR